MNYYMSEKFFVYLVFSYFFMKTEPKIKNFDIRFFFSVSFFI